jgi:virginiamycin B lyase
MTGTDRIDPRLAGLLHDLAGSADEPLDEVLRRTAGTRQRPAWTFPERWLPLSATTTRFLPQVGKPWFAAALVLLLLAAALAVTIGMSQRPTVPLPARLDLDIAATQRLDVADATYPAAGLGRLWVTIAGAGVAQLDPATGAQVRLTQIPASACGYIEVAFDRVWTPTCQTGGIAGVSLAGDITMIPVDAAVSDELTTIGVGDQALWLVAGGLGDQLVKVDPASRSVVGRFTIAAGLASPAVGFDSIWLANKNTGQALRIDPASGAVQATIPVGKLPRFVAAGLGAIWVVNQQDGTVSRIDPATNKVTSTIEVGAMGPQDGGIRFAGGSVWVRTTNEVARIDPGAGRVIEIDGPALGWGAITTDGNSVWVTSPDSGKVWRLATK